MDCCIFFKCFGIGVGVGLVVMQFLLVKKLVVGEVQVVEGKGDIVVCCMVCLYCLVGCLVDVVVQNGVWVCQELVFDLLINLGVYCVKGVVLCEYGYGEYCLKMLMKFVDGCYQCISWEQVFNEIVVKMNMICQEMGLDLFFFVGLFKYSNEQLYLLCKWVLFFGINNCDYQVCICYSIIVVGVVNIWGYGVMMNLYNDMQNVKCVLYIGLNVVEVYFVLMLYLLYVKEMGCKVIVVDLCYMCMVVKFDEYVCICLGIDIVFLFGVLYYIFKNGWEDKQYIYDCVYGMDKVCEEVFIKWMLDKVEEVCGVFEVQVYKVVEMMVMNCLSMLVWCMGQMQYIIGNVIVCVLCIV